jgi:hypothetical protein
VLVSAQYRALMSILVFGPDICCDTLAGRWTLTRG